MCGRYQFYITPSKKGNQLKEKVTNLNLVFKQGEIFPNDNVLCVIPKENKIDLDVKKWGIKTKSLLINARVETINDRLTFNSIKHNRCAVIANGFYEWDQDKNKFYITCDDDYMYLACIFNENNELIILTEAADKAFSKIHSRKPIIMNQDEMLKFIHNKNCIFEKKILKFDHINQDITLF